MISFLSFRDPALTIGVVDGQCGHLGNCGGLKSSKFVGIVLFFLGMMVFMINTLF